MPSKSSTSPLPLPPPPSAAAVSSSSTTWTDRWIAVRVDNDISFRRRWIVLAPTQLEIYLSDTNNNTSSVLPIASLPLTTLKLATPSSHSHYYGHLPSNTFILFSPSSSTNTRRFTMKCADSLEYKEVLNALTDLQIDLAPEQQSSHKQQQRASSASSVVHSNIDLEQKRQNSAPPSHNNNISSTSTSLLLFSPPKPINPQQQQIGDLSSSSLSSNSPNNSKKHDPSNCSFAALLQQNEKLLKQVEEQLVKRDAEFFAAVQKHDDETKTLKDALSEQQAINTATKEQFEEQISHLKKQHESELISASVAQSTLAKQQLEHALNEQEEKLNTKHQEEVKQLERNLEEQFQKKNQERFEAFRSKELKLLSEKHDDEILKLKDALSQKAEKSIELLNNKHEKELAQNKEEFQNKLLEEKQRHESLRAEQQLEFQRQLSKHDDEIASQLKDSLSKQRQELELQHAAKLEEAVAKQEQQATQTLLLLEQQHQQKQQQLESALSDATAASIQLRNKLDDYERQLRAIREVKKSMLHKSTQTDENDDDQTTTKKKTPQEIEIENEIRAFDQILQDFSQRLLSSDNKNTNNNNNTSTNLFDDDHHDDGTTPSDDRSPLPHYEEQTQQHENDYCQHLLMIASQLPNAFAQSKQKLEKLSQEHGKNDNNQDHQQHSLLLNLLAALLHRLKQRNRVWLHHHLCAESIARFALALKRAGKILKSVRGCSKFAEEFESSWKITEQLIQLPRLLVEEDHAFALLYQVLLSNSSVC